MAKKNVSKFVILGLLNLESMSGYDIKKCIEDYIQDFWHESYGNIYPTLKKLIDEGLAEKTAIKQTGKPDRFVHNITQKGKEKLIFWLNQPFELPRIRNEFLVKLFFGSNLPLENISRNIRNYRSKLQQKLDFYNETETLILKQKTKEKRYLLIFLTFRQGKLILKSRLDWCEEALVTIEQFKNS